MTRDYIMGYMKATINLSPIINSEICSMTEHRIRFIKAHQSEFTDDAKNYIKANWRSELEQSVFVD